MDLLSGVSDAALVARLLAYYRQTAGFINASLGGTPLVLRNFPAGLDRTGYFDLTPFPVSVNRLLWAVHAKAAVEFHSWAPLPEDEDRLRFARILLEPPQGGVAFARIAAAARAMQGLLAEVAQLKAVALLDGTAGIALWLPLSDAPHAAVLREWLHRLAQLAAMRYPDLISTEPNTHGDGRVHLHVASNAPRRFSAVPYSLRAPGLTTVVPIRWDELDAFDRADAVGRRARAEIRSRTDRAF